MNSSYAFMVDIIPPANDLTKYQVALLLVCQISDLLKQDAFILKVWNNEVSR